MKRSGTICAASSRIGSTSTLYGCSSKDDRVTKHRLENVEEEMQACFARLMQLVPTIPPNGRMSKVQLLQHVIDYILDLETTLDFRPSESRHTDQASGKTDASEEVHIVSGIVPTTLDRKPLKENAFINSLPSDTSLQVSSTIGVTPSSSSSPMTHQQLTSWS